MLAGVFTAAGAAALASAAGYQTMAPTGQWYGRTFVGLPAASRQLALTYDDGPNDPHTLRLLEVLARHSVRATFFLIGHYITRRPDIVRDLAKAGHAIGNHTFSHPNLIFALRERTKTELQRCEHALKDAIGEHAMLFRPPFGGRRPGTFSIARSLGLEPIMWRVNGYDWKGRPAEYIEKMVHGRLCGGDVILLHDGGHRQFGADRLQTVIATDRLVARLKSEGYEFASVPEMMKKAVPSDPFPVLSSRS